MNDTNKFKNRLDNLMKRRTLQDSVEFASLENMLLESIAKSEDSDIKKYIDQSAEEVDKRYTEISYEEGKRVKNHLEKKIENISFKYQGSVSNNTHIKASSDLDLLTILEDSSLYNEEGLLKLKNNSEIIIKENFPKVNVSRGSKSLCLEGGSLKRKIDVVSSCWDLEKEKLHGISIYDENNSKILSNTPFYHNYLLDMKESSSGGFYKKAVRLLKNIKFSLEEELKSFAISSYDITALIYRIDFTGHTMQKNTDLVLFLVRELNRLLSRGDLHELLVPDGSRKIIQNQEIISDIRVLIEELIDINNQLENLQSPKLIYTPIASKPKAWGTNE